MNFNEFKLLTTELYETNKDFKVILNDDYSFHYGTHGSIAGPYRGFWIRQEYYLHNDYGTNVMDSVNYTIEEFYDFMVEHNLFTDLKFKIEEALLKGI